MTQGRVPRLLLCEFLLEVHVSNILCAKSVLAMVAKAGAVQLESTKNEQELYNNELSYKPQAKRSAKAQSDGRGFSPVGKAKGENP